MQIRLGLILLVLWGVLDVLGGTAFPTPNRRDLPRGWLPSIGRLCNGSRWRSKACRAQFGKSRLLALGRRSLKDVEDTPQHEQY